VKALPATAASARSYLDKELAIQWKLFKQIIVMITKLGQAEAPGLRPEQSVVQHLLQ